MYKLIASDMDETFLDSTHSIPAANVEALRRLRALGVQGLAVDLTLYVLTMAGGFLLAARLSRSGPARRLTGASLLAVMLYGAALVLFTFAAPPLGIFQP